MAHRLLPNRRRRCLRPELERFEAAGDSFVSSGEHEKASDEYKRALFLLGSERSSRRAALYVKLGESARALGKARVALNEFREGARHRRRGRASVSKLRRRRARGARFRADRGAHAAQSRGATERRRQDRRLSGKLPTLAGSRLGSRARFSALERWLAADGSNREALESKAKVELSLERYSEAVDTLAALAGSSTASEAVTIFCEAAELALGKLGDARRALGLYLRALDADVESPVALARAEGVLAEQRDHAGLADLYERVAKRSQDAEKRLARAPQAFATLSRGAR